MRRSRIHFVTLAVTLAVATGCGGDNDDSSVGSTGRCNMDLLRVCLANGGGAPCKTHGGRNNCDDEDLARARSADASAGQGFGWPTQSRNVTSKFGPRASPCAGCSSFHQGIDIGIGVGNRIFASHSGNATANWAGCGGNTMVVTRRDGNLTKYLHLSSFVANGKYVEKAQVIAKSGNTGSCTTGPHLHFEVHVGGKAVNPLKHIR